MHALSQTAAADTIVRMALLLAALDPWSPFTEAQRVWATKRCESCAPLTAKERARIQAPLLAYLATYHARSHAIVARQFEEPTP